MSEVNIDNNLFGAFFSFRRWFGNVVRSIIRQLHSCLIFCNITPVVSRTVSICQDEHDNQTNEFTKDNKERAQCNSSNVEDCAKLDSESSGIGVNPTSGGHSQLRQRKSIQGVNK